MQNRFGLKDLVLLLLVIVGIILTALSMGQSDRAFARNEVLLKRLQDVEGQVGRIDSRLGEVGAAVNGVKSAIDQGIKVSGTGPAGNTAASSSTSSANAAGTGDSSWARPGVKIEEQPPLGFSTDPRAQPGFADGGEFTEIWEAQTKVLTPDISTDVYSRRVQELVLESLAVYDPVKLTRRGVLAEAWQVDPDGLWLRARLRPGVRFSDGTPLTAEDLRWSFHEFTMNEQIEAERSRSILRDSIKKVTAIDDRTVEFEFVSKLFTNVDNALGLFVLPKHIFSKLSPAQINSGTGLLVGSGPFRLRGFSVDSQWAPPADVVIERNEQYWGPRPTLQSIRFQAISEEIGRLNSFAKGDADIITPSAPQFVAKSADDTWKERATFLNWINMRTGYTFIAWNGGERNGKITPFHDKRVRQAMTLSLDREKMIRDIWKGIGVVAKGNQPLASPGSNDAIKPWPFDPERAKALFKEAGWEDRNGNGVMEDKAGNEFKFQFTFSGGGEIAERISKFVKDSYTQAGIRVELRPVEWAVMQDLLKTRDFDAITMGWGANAPESDPKQIFHSESIKNQGDNFAQWNSKRGDELIDSGRREMDTDKRMAIWREFEAVLHEDQPYTFIMVRPWLRFVGKSVGNVVPYPKGLEPVEFFKSGATVPNPGK